MSGPPLDATTPPADPPEAAPGGIRGRIASVRAKVDARVDVVRDRFPYVDLVLDFGTRWREVNAGALAGHLAYRSFLWLLPMLLLGVAIAGFASASNVDVGDSAGGLLDLGGTTASTIAAAADDAESSRVSILWVALLGVVLGARGLIQACVDAFALAWQLGERPPKRPWVALFKFLGGALLVVFVIGLTVALRRKGILLSTVGLGGTFVVYFLVLVFVSWTLPHRGDDWRNLIPGAVFGTMGFVGLKAFAVFYLPSRVDRFLEVYGSLGLSLIFLSYLFLVGQVLVATAVINAVWLDHRSEVPTLDRLLRLIPTGRRTATAEA